LNSIKIVCEVGHKVSDLIYLIVFLREIFATIEHTASQIGFELDTRAEEANSPQKSSYDHAENYEQQWEAYLIKKIVYIERNPIDICFACLYAVNNYAVKLRDNELHIVNENECKQS
jgi:hypothetical protein